MEEFKFSTFQIRALKALGLWSLRPRTFMKWMHTLMIISLQVLHLSSCLTNLIKCDGGLNCYLENFTYTLIIATGIYGFIVYMIKEKVYVEITITLHNIVDQFNTYEYTNPAEEHSRRLSVGFTIYTTIGLIQYGMCPILDYNSCLRRDIKDSALTCGLPTPGSFPFDSTTSPGYEAALIFQCINALLCLQSMMQPVLMCLMTAYHTVAQLRMVQNNLQKVCLNPPEKRSYLLRKCIEHHAAVLNFSNQVSAALNELMLMYAVLVSLILTVLLFQIMQMLLTTVYIWFLFRYVLMITGFLVMVIVLSVVGQILIDESLNVADVAYNIPWYEEPLGFQQMIRLIILRAHKPLLLRSASISELSLSSFRKVMGSTYSYLALLYNTLLSKDD